MAKRFVDTDLFRKPLVRGLATPYKLLWVYLLCECDHAGVWDVELDVASMRLGSKMDEAKCLTALGASVVPIDGGRKWWIPEFVAFQYGDLNPANKVHASVLAILARYSIDPSLTKKEGASEGLGSPLQGAKDIDKEKDNSEKKEHTKQTFLDLWKTFDGYGAKSKAWAYWLKLSEEDRASVIANAPAYVKSTPGCQYRKQLEGWINPDNRLWERPIVVKTQPNGKPMYGKEQADAEMRDIRLKNGRDPVYGLVNNTECSRELLIFRGLIKA